MITSLNVLELFLHFASGFALWFFECNRRVLHIVPLENLGLAVNHRMFSLSQRLELVLKIPELLFKSTLGFLMAFCANYSKS